MGVRLVSFFVFPVAGSAFPSVEFRLFGSLIDSVSGGEAAFVLIGLPFMWGDEFHGGVEALVIVLSAESWNPFVGFSMDV